MAQKDIIVRDIKVEYEGVFSFDEFYKYLKNWMKRRNYKEGELKYKETKKDGKISTEIIYGGQKKVDDYIKIMLEIQIKAIDLVEVIKKGSKKKMHDGKLELVFMGYLQKDYENKWEKNPVLLFFREVYDKWVIGDRITKIENELKDDVNKLINEVKAFLKLLKI